MKRKPTSKHPAQRGSSVSDPRSVGWNSLNGVVPLRRGNLMVGHVRNMAENAYISIIIPLATLLFQNRIWRFSDGFVVDAGDVTIVAVFA